MAITATQGLMAVGLLSVLFGADLMTLFGSSKAQQVLRQRFPGMEVIPSTYPVSPQKALLARVVMGLQFGGIAAVLAGDRIFPALGLEMPQLLAQMQEKRMGVVMGIWLLGNAAQNQLTSTGAFEVFYNGKKMHSKLGTGRVPSMEELISSIELAMGS